MEAGNLWFNVMARQPNELSCEGVVGLVNLNEWSRPTDEWSTGGSVLGPGQQVSVESTSITRESKTMFSRGAIARIYLCFSRWFFPQQPI